MPSSEDPMSPTSSQPPNIERRFKLSRACDRCRRRRIKCDEGHPCKSCINASSECTFDEIGKKTTPHKSKRSTLEERMQQLETLIGALPAGLFKPSSGSQSATPTDAPTPQYPTSNSLGVPPPSLSIRSLVNPSRHFLPSHDSPLGSLGPIDAAHSGPPAPLPLSSSYLYLDDQGMTRWQGEMSGFPLLDLLIEREMNATVLSKRSESPESSRTGGTPNNASNNFNNNGTHSMEEEPASPAPTEADWFPDRKPVQAPVKPETIWQMVTSSVEPDLMDSLVRCFLSTTYYLMPFIHVPTFLSDYADPEKWDTGFASFIIAVCCLTSRHVDDVRVRAEAGNPFSAGAHFFELFIRLRALPGADRPTLYTVQATLVAAVYAMGLGKLSRGIALLSEAVTLCIDAGLHRSVAAYDHFDHIETEVRKRTFWCVYAWDKQAAAYFGRPPMIRLRDCDVPEPEQVDDEHITKDGVAPQPSGVPSLMSAFVCTCRLYVIIEAVLDVHPVADFSSTPQSFLARASAALSGYRQSRDLREAEIILNEWCTLLPSHWAVTAETMSSRDVVRITQAERLHCLEHFTRMLIHRYRFTGYIAHPAPGNEEPRAMALRMAQRSALQIIAKHLEISSLGLMTYYGLFVIHQLTQAGRTLIAVLLESKEDNSMVAASLDALKACVGLLRRFSGRYVCGLRSADLLEEICRLSQIPLEILEQRTITTMRPAWLRPVRKRPQSRSDASDFGSPTAQMQNAQQFPQLENGHMMTGPHGMSPPVLSTSKSENLLPQAFNAQFVSSQGGLMEPLMAGMVEPLSADMFSSTDIAGFSSDDLLTLLGSSGGGGVPLPSSTFSTSLMQPPTPLGFGMDLNIQLPLEIRSPETLMTQTGP